MNVWEGVRISKSIDILYEQDKIWRLGFLAINYFEEYLILQLCPEY